jgi:KDO2-lipid IV(A) lauroyltransferase
VARKTFIHVAQSFLDRAWLWHADPEVVRRRVVLTGSVRELAGSDPTIVFAPHFVGLDAGVTGLSQQVQRRFIGIYTKQSNPVVDAWVLQGRNRFGIRPRPMSRSEGVREIISAPARGRRHDPAARHELRPGGIDLRALLRRARRDGAVAVAVRAAGTREGGAGDHADAARRLRGAGARRLGGLSHERRRADTALMNRRLQEYVDEIPAQYYWVHKRFKTRPPGEPGVY